MNHPWTGMVSGKKGGIGDIDSRPWRIIPVFQSGALKLPADDFAGLLLGFKIRGDFPAWEDLIRYAPEDLREWIARNKQTFSK